MIDVSQMSEKEKTAHTYTSALDSVSFILKGVAASVKDKVGIKRNVDHLKIILAKPIWSNEDLTPFKNAIAVGEAEC